MPEARKKCLRNGLTHINTHTHWISTILYGQVKKDDRSKIQELDSRNLIRNAATKNNNQTIKIFDYCYKVDKCSKNVETTLANISTIKCHIAASRKSTDITCLHIGFNGFRGRQRYSLGIE